MGDVGRVGAAKPRRDRQLRAFHRHEQLTELATALHHSAQRPKSRVVEEPSEGEVRETYEALRRLKDAASSLGGAGAAPVVRGTVVPGRGSSRSRVDAVVLAPTLSSSRDAVDSAPLLPPGLVLSRAGEEKEEEEEEGEEESAESGGVRLPVGPGPGRYLLVRPGPHDASSILSARW